MLPARAGAQLEDALAHRGQSHSPWADLEVSLCRAAGLPQQHWRETLDKHGAHPTVAAQEKPSSHPSIYRKSLHQSINSSPTDAAHNASPVWGELWEMELTPTPALSPLSPSSEAAEHPAGLQDPGGAITVATGFPCPPLPACQAREQNSQGPLIRTGSQSFAAEILGLGERMGWVMGAGWGVDAKKGRTHQKNI